MKCLAYSKSPVSKMKKFFVTSGTETKGNTSIPDVLLTHSQEEADTLLILHALTVDKDAELIIDSPDTDDWNVSQAASCYEFSHREEEFEKKYRSSSYLWKTWKKRTSAMIGFHAFTGSDVRRFAGRRKDWCFKVYLKCDSSWCFGTRVHISQYLWPPCILQTSLRYTRRSKIFGGSWFLIMLLRERVFHLPLVH